MEMKREMGKVVHFTQSEKNEKVFRHDYAVSEEVQKVMINEVTNKFRNYVFGGFYSTFVPVLEEYLDDHNVRMEKHRSMLLNLFWCRLL